MPWFDLGLAWGGYIKEKFGIFGGLSIFANSSSYSPSPSTFTDAANSSSYKPATFTIPAQESGKYYMTNYMKGGACVDFHFIYAISEQFIARATYSFAGVSLKEPENESHDGTGVNYSTNGRRSRRIEAGLFYQLSEKFGFFAKYTFSNLRANSSMVTTTITQAGKTSTERYELALFPDQRWKMNVFTIGVMIPLSSEYQGGNVTVTPR
jgi:hypothetical protein